MLLDRHRAARLVELSGLERTVKGPERVLREDDVTAFVKAAYDDATDEARAAFMQRIQRLPTSAWPWSAVQVPATVSAATIGGVVAAPKPPATPPALILLRGQAESADVDPANRLPDRGTPAALEWEPLYKALDAWDTQTILKAIGPQGWVSIIGNTSGQVSKDTGTSSTNGTANNTPSGTTNGSTSGTTNGSTSGPPASGKAPSVDLPAPQEPTSPPAISWKHPAVIAAGAAVVVAVGGVVVYNLGQDHKRSRLEEALGRQGEES